MKNLMRISGLSILSLTLMFLVGCGGGVERQANVNEGDYYSAEEFEKLNEEQRDAYCADLDAELARLENDKSGQMQSYEATQAQLAQVQQDVKAAEADYNARKAETDAIQEEIYIETSKILEDQTFTRCKKSQTELKMTRNIAPSLPATKSL